MPTTNPNRDKTHSTGREEVRRKQSGDQHMLPEGEPMEDPHRPHRLNRQDMQKPDNPQPDEDDAGTRH